mgnify:CR=1 FL=1|jgi:S-adenosylmethionine decarboxylase
MDRSKTAFQLGMELGQAPRDPKADCTADPTGTAPRKAQAEVAHNTESQAIRAEEQHQVLQGPWTDSASSLDHFKRKDGRIFAGTHMILDLWGASRLDDIEHIETTLREAVTAAKATLLHIHLHHFTDNGGVSGVAVLAESHISIHTWPERDYAALDIFMCGDAEPENAIAVFRTAFMPSELDVDELYRGDLTDAA